ncbi:hypothetical protein FXN61_26315 [Lentzea sp. PSKA42]|uniref:Uncharacterized protein n=1 Tax=Lentzea indica TaxID=2604800 RepID=A0ABX1FMB4_9PSEU|nr:hypothetical protein [Lentzea indica]NKE60123.1 hypothetical protein [Lentzea indica]
MGERAQVLRQRAERFEPFAGGLTGLRRRAGRRPVPVDWPVVAAAGFVFAALVYVLAVLTKAGQTIENAALCGADQTTS